MWIISVNQWPFTRWANNLKSVNKDFLILWKTICDLLVIDVFYLQTALDIRQSVFGGKNIHVATAHEDLAYSSYVHQYSSGKFDNALWVSQSRPGRINYMFREKKYFI